MSDAFLGTMTLALYLPIRLQKSSFCSFFQARERDNHLYGKALRCCDAQVNSRGCLAHS